MQPYLIFSSMSSLHRQHRVVSTALPAASLSSLVLRLFLSQFSLSNATPTHPASDSSTGSTRASADGLCKVFVLMCCSKHVNCTTLRLLNAFIFIFVEALKSCFYLLYWCFLNKKLIVVRRNKVLIFTMKIVMLLLLVFCCLQVCSRSIISQNLVYYQNFPKKASLLKRFYVVSRNPCQNRGIGEMKQIFEVDAKYFFGISRKCGILNFKMVY